MTGQPLEMSPRVTLGHLRAEAFRRATQRKGQPMSYGSGKPPEKSPKQS